MSNFFFKLKFLSSLLIFGILVFSCASREDVVYFQNAKNFETTVDTDTFVPKFKVNDIVSIFVSTYDLESVKPFNLVGGNDEGTGTKVSYVDYLVDIDGNIDYPVLGKIKLLDLTVDEAKELLKEKLSAGYLENPIINMRIKNFRVTVLGEVSRPGTYQISGERVTIMEALGLAGDIGIKGRRDNVLIIRDFDGTKSYTRINLLNKEIFNSPIYYLTQNDVVYVEPNKSAIRGSSIDNSQSIAISVASILITSTILLLTRRR